MMASAAAVPRDDGGGDPPHQHRRQQHRIAVGAPPCFLYYYRETRYAQDPEGVLRYRMEAILPCPPSPPRADDAEETRSHYYHYYHSRAIEHSGLRAVDLAHLQLFNSICIPEANARTMRFTFATQHHGAYTCLVTPAGQLAIDRYDATAPAYDAATALTPSSFPLPLLLLDVDDDPHHHHHAEEKEKEGEADDLDTYHAASVYTLTHDYIQSSTPGRHIHVGASFVPCGTLFIPLWLGEDGMRALLAQWYEQKLPVARTEALVTVRLLDGGSSIRHVVPRLREKHQHVAASR
jgi:hypothetical protein